MFDLIFFLFPILFVAVLIMVVAGFVRHARFASRVFDLAERELEQRSRLHAQSPSVTAESSTPRRCTHCNSPVAATGMYPSCGAPLL